jgi:hypothetical protein
VTDRPEQIRGELDALLDAHHADASHLPAEAEGRFSRERIVEAIHDWTQRFGEPPKVYDWDPALARRRGQDWRAERFEAGDWPTLAIVRRQFGNLSKALFAAGIRPRQGPTRARGHVLTDEQILAAIREWHRRYGEPPTRSDWSPARALQLGQEWRVDRYRAGNWPSFNTVVRRFGTLTEAVRAAGLEPRPRGRHATGRGSLAPATREVLVAGLDGPWCGPHILASRVRQVSQARSAADHDALRGALLDLAAAAVSWAETLPADRIAYAEAA